MSGTEDNVTAVGLSSSSQSSNFAYEDEKYLPKFSQEEWDLKVLYCTPICSTIVNERGAVYINKHAKFRSKQFSRNMSFI